MLSENKKTLLDRLSAAHTLALDEYEALVRGFDRETADYAAALAIRAREPYYGKRVYIRGLIEVGNVCKNDCYYCGIRRSNRRCERYVLTKQEILACCREGYDLGFRTFVLQGGEGSLSVDSVCDIVSGIRREYPDCAITLSLGEYSHQDYRRMYSAGANRYLLRHETADLSHYERLHPAEMSFQNRMNCLFALREIGFQVGCGWMVGSPFQTEKTLAEDLKFVETFSPDMCGIGPFLPQKDTPFGTEPPGSAGLTVYLLSLVRLISPSILLPATTALGSAQKDGRERGLLAGANVVMPNLSPASVRSKYALYDNKLFTGSESAQSLALLKESAARIGYEIDCARGDKKPYSNSI